MRAVRALALAAACGIPAAGAAWNASHAELMTRRHLQRASDGSLQFGVWGPSAQSCKVTCAGQTTQLQKSGDFWTGSASGCSPGASYTINLGNGEKPDYLGRDATVSGTQSIVPQAYTFSSSAKFVDKTKVLVYEMHIPSFTSGGTFTDAIEKLDYLADTLGVTVLELMPVSFTCSNWQGWGYDNCLPWAINPSMGGSLGLKKFVDAANQKGLGVIVDVVYNHFAGGTPLTSGYGGDPFFYSDSRRNSPWGPRPNYDNDYVRDSFLIGNLKMFMQEYHIAGFRWDSTICIRQGANGGDCWASGQPAIPMGWKLMQNGNDQVHALGNAFTVAEDMQNDFGITKATGQGGAGFDGQWGYRFFFDVIGQITQSNVDNVDMGKVASACVMDDGGDPSAVTFTENHDRASSQNGGRVAHRVQPQGGDPNWWTAKKSMLAMGLVLTCRGWPMLFQGQEYLEMNDFAYPIPPKFDWSRAASSLVHEVKDMAYLRTNRRGTSPGLLGGFSSGGKTLMVSNDQNNKVAVIHRWGPGGDAIVIFNFHNTYYQSYGISNVPKDGRWTKRFDGDSKSYFGDYKDQCAWAQWMDVSGGKGSMCVPEMSMVILTSP
eukprot:TRINITY_DN17173_c0_g1_i1.p1 TRINITY_DN17173_c0_g1~~TRINITY_DN17173_c0_g1_i1.p1  ORF type:complete len:633 (+),score=182.01 TRINITY_DN17173_c0_g1_i1:96-1901(+)